MFPEKCAGRRERSLASTEQRLNHVNALFPAGCPNEKGPVVRGLWTNGGVSGLGLRLWCRMPKKLPRQQPPQ
jgi:hypothetical protein